MKGLSLSRVIPKKVSQCLLYNENDIAFLMHVAQQLHWDLLNQLNKAAVLTEENQMQVTPEPVYISDSPSWLIGSAGGD